MKKPHEGGFFVPDRSQLNDSAREELWGHCAMAGGCEWPEGRLARAGRNRERGPASS
jgi:hypothetical protein